MKTSEKGGLLRLSKQAANNQKPTCQLQKTVVFWVVVKKRMMTCYGQGVGTPPPRRTGMAHIFRS
jgi:hypothetical protein